MGAAFKQANARQFDRARQALQDVSREYVRLIAADLIERTPGFGNQAPEDTPYIPTGRLRGGWNFVLQPVLSSAKGLGVKRDEHGPFSDYGRETLARITEQLQAQKMGGISYLENDVGYGDLIRRGAGRHRAVGPRNWPKDTQRSQELFARQAVQSLGRKSK